MSDKDSDVIELCRQVLSMSPHQYENPNGADDSTCPFCYERLEYLEEDLSEIDHDMDCAYLIAKDLNTGHEQ